MLNWTRPDLTGDDGELVRAGIRETTSLSNEPPGRYCTELDMTTYQGYTIKVFKLDKDGPLVKFGRKVSDSPFFQDNRLVSTSLDTEVPRFS